VDGTVYCGTASDGVVAVDASTATVRWESSLGGMVIGNPVVLGDLVYAASSAGMHALDAATGAVVWEHGVRATNVVATPAADDTTLYFGIDRTYYALEQGSHAERWTVDVGGVLGLSVANGLVYATSSDGIIYALDAATGEVRWQFAGEDIFWSGVSVSDTTVFVGNSDHFVYALDALTGAERWRFQTTDWVLSDPLLAGAVLYVGIGTHVEDTGARPVYALDATTGAELWRFDTNGLIHAGLTMANGLLYVVTTGGELYALE
jgi:outer membrane protein assembly factor BamB